MRPAALLLAALASCGGGRAAPGAISCESYCATAAAACAGPSAPYPVGAISCAAYCGVVARWPAGAESGPPGDTLRCRLERAEEALSMAAWAPADCVAAGPTGGGVCGALCDVYCDLAAKNCQGASALYATQGDCLAACAAFPADGAADAATGDTVQCRMTQLAFAYAAPATFCPAAAAASATCR